MERSYHWAVSELAADVVAIVQPRTTNHQLRLGAQQRSPSLISQPLTGNGTVSAHITLQSNTDSWAKAGVVLRQSSVANSTHYSACKA